MADVTWPQVVVVGIVVVGILGYFCLMTRGE
jgi:hypothetical protein